MPLPLINNKIRTDGPREALSNSFGRVRNQGTKWHKGWDLLAEPGTPIFAVGSGLVVQVHPDATGFGRCLLLEIENPKYREGLKQSVGIANCKRLYALYAHLSKVDVTVGAPIKKGDQLGKTGVSGNASGEPPHLHFEVLLENSLAKPTPRVDPGELLGYELYACGGEGLVNQELFGSCRAD